MIIGGNCGCVQ